jgi:hypothetical protein
MAVLPRPAAVRRVFVLGSEASTVLAYQGVISRLAAFSVWMVSLRYRASMAQRESFRGIGADPEALPFTAANEGKVRMLNIEPWNGESARPPEYAVESPWAAAEYHGEASDTCELALIV